MKFSINGCEWEIKECNNNAAPLCNVSLCGRTYFFDKRIFLNENLPRDQKEKTLRHELAHAFITETQITTQNKDEEYNEEMLCEFVGHYGKQIEAICAVYFDKKLI